MNNDPENQSDEAANRFETGKAHAKRAAEELRAAAQAKAGELRETAAAKAQEWRDTATSKASEWRDAAAARTQEWRGQAQDYYDTARDRARVIQDDGEAFVRDNPSRAVLMAMGVGFVIGLLFRGGRR